MEEERLSVSALQGRVTSIIQEDPLIEDMKIQISKAHVHVDRGETSMHLCVKRNQVEALKALVEEMTKEQIRELVNSKDCEGNTILHLAVSNKHSEIINYILTLNGLQVNALNENGLTALDILLQSPPDPRDIEIENVLRNARASSVKDLYLITNNWFLGNIGHTTKKLSSDWFGTNGSILTATASLIATVAFQAGLFQSSIWPDECILDKNWKTVNHQDSDVQSMSVVDSMLFFMVLTMVTVIFIIAGFGGIGVVPLKRRWWMSLQMAIMWIAVGVEAVIYLVKLRHVTVLCQGQFASVTSLNQ